MRIGILGGTFDPIHYGHLVVAEECRYSLQLERVLLVPAGQPPHKVGRAVAPAADRLAMVELAVAGNCHLAVSRIEIERPGLSYSVDTVALLREEYSRQAELFFIIGLDALFDLVSWHEPRRLLQLCKLAAVSRPGYQFDLSPLLGQLPEVAERVVYVPTPELNIASSDLRQRVATGRPIRYQLPDAVAQYIYDHGLYRNGQ